ncbi:class I SAM-dependent methyltransferase [Actinomadura sp. DC4]|uniref:class I SAM-dependent DNA methyltransferase n=1 Tax=Actinomadura sp. DC4 TaxID=3055069 RepID=UPI0025AEE8E4|nr:class I SAM-dependent methyltransferase [Actinomadura sp. DC4]MDN3357977.1 methyltransferase domain-containing protein [Actinomadura sp. DC4]
MTQDPGGLYSRADRQAAQAWAFDRIGEHYDAAFPHKEGQIAAGEWLLERLAPGSRVLDVGCGTGIPTARQLSDAGHKVTGVDISGEMLRLAHRDVPDAEFRHLDIADLDPTLGAFAAVVAFFSLLMLPRAEIPSALTKIHQVIEPEGYFLLSMVEADLDDTPIHFLGSPVRVTGYVRSELEKLVIEAGFEVIGLRHLSYAPASTELLPEVQLFLFCRRDGRR